MWDSIWRLSEDSILSLRFCGKINRKDLLDARQIDEVFRGASWVRQPIWNDWEGKFFHHISNIMLTYRSGIMLSQSFIILNDIRSQSFGHRCRFLSNVWLCFSFNSWIARREESIICENVETSCYIEKTIYEDVYNSRACLLKNFSFDGFYLFKEYQQDDSETTDLVIYQDWRLFFESFCCARLSWFLQHTSSGHRKKVAKLSQRLWSMCCIKQTIGFGHQWNCDCEWFLYHSGIRYRADTVDSICI